MTYDQGGIVGGPKMTRVVLCFDECVVRFEDGRPTCIRNHPIHDATFWANYPKEWRP